VDPVDAAGASVTTYADVIAHIDACATCEPGRPCRAATALFVAARDAVVERAVPTLVVDVAGHAETCTDCNATRLCPAARELHDEAREALRGRKAGRA